MPISPSDVQQSVNVIDQIPQNMSGLTDQYIGQLNGLNQAILQSASMVAGAAQDPAFQAATQQAAVDIANLPGLVNEAKTKINSQLDAINAAAEQLSTAMQSMAQIAIPNANNVTTVDPGDTTAWASKNPITLRRLK